MAHITINFRSNALMMPVMLDVLLPEDCKECKTLYLLHEFGGSRESWLLKSRIVELVEGRQIAVIMPSGNNKFFINNRHGKAYHTFLTEELICQVEKWFAVSRKASDRFIAGAEMGGYGAMEAVASNPEAYHTAFSYAGLLYALKQSDAVSEHTLYTVFGTKEEMDARILELQGKLAEIMAKDSTKAVIWGDLNDPWSTNRDYFNRCLQKTIDFIEAGGY